MHDNKKCRRSVRLAEKYAQHRNLNNDVLNPEGQYFDPDLTVPGLFSKQTLSEAFSLFERLVIIISLNGIF